MRISTSGSALASAVGLRRGDAEGLVQRVGARPARLDELRAGRGRWTRASDLDGLGQPAADLVAQDPEQRLAVAGRRDLDLHLVAQLLVDLLRGAVQATELARP